MYSWLWQRVRAKLTLHSRLFGDYGSPELKTHPVLADRNILVDQTKTNDFQPFGTAMTKVTGRTVDPAYEIHLALYQALTGPEDHQKHTNRSILISLTLLSLTSATVAVPLKTAHGARFLSISVLRLK